MEFTLFYRGVLKSNGRSKDKQKIRRYFHPQLKNLWNQLPLTDHKELLDETSKDGEFTIIQNINGFNFAPLVTEKLHLIAELEIILLKPEQPGSIITQSGDIDNRLKTLLDSLRTPKETNEIPSEDTPKKDENPFFCLLEDDNLITALNVKTERLLENITNQSEVILIIKVVVKSTRTIWENIGLG